MICMGVVISKLNKAKENTMPELLIKRLYRLVKKAHPIVPAMKIKHEKINI